MIKRIYIKEGLYDGLPNNQFIGYRAGDEKGDLLNTTFFAEDKQVALDYISRDEESQKDIHLIKVKITYNNPLYLSQHYNKDYHKLLNDIFFGIDKEFNKFTDEDISNILSRIPDIKEWMEYYIGRKSNKNIIDILYNYIFYSGNKDKLKIIFDYAKNKNYDGIILQDTDWTLRNTVISYVVFNEKYNKQVEILKTLQE